MLKKRNYNQLLEDDNNTDSNNEELKVKVKVNNYEFLTKTVSYILNKGQKYYYTDEVNLEWEFKEKAGTIYHYYFVCSTTKCNGFGMINRKDKENKFILIKKHNCSYINHSYNNASNIDKIYKDNNFEQKVWDEIDFRRNYINWYFKNNEKSKLLV